MKTIMSLALTLLTLHVVISQVLPTIDSYQGPSPYQYSLDLLFSRIDNKNNLVAGWRQYGDELVYRQNFTIDPKPGSRDTRVDELFNSFKANITHVLSLEATGQYNGARAYLVKGGVNFLDVTIGYAYTAQYGLTHTIEIYGYPVP